MAKTNNKSLVIVESPAKVKTIGKFLGKDFTIVASYGHIIDLPKSKIGVDIEDGFRPTYVVLKKKNKVLAAIKKQAKGKAKIYLATDPDREGEAIGWHIQANLSRVKPKSKGKKDGARQEFLRVVFHEITKDAVCDAFRHPRSLNPRLIDAQQGRRILDRIVGYQLSPLLWKKVGRGLSAGRVQSVALRLIVEREREILAFKPKEYWQVEAELARKGRGEDKGFKARLDKIDGKKAEIVNREQADNIVNELQGAKFAVDKVTPKEKRRNPYPPFITSTLQQDAFNKLGFTSNRTMALAQALYEGVDLPGGPQGLITYMRTDSPRVADVALKQARDYIEKEFGRDYLPARPNYYRAKKSAQQAHEAIRPTSVLRTPQEMAKYLDKDLLRLYRLIWGRFVASQMSPALYRVVSVDIKAGRFTLRAAGTRLLFSGFLQVYGNDSGAKDKEEASLHPLRPGEELALLHILPSQHWTKPPPRFSDASLVRLLEENGIGRPSTYAPILQTLVRRDYVRRAAGYLSPTELGMKVVDLLVKYFARVMDVEFSARVEERLDDVEEGKTDYRALLRDFYSSFSADLEFARDNIKKEVVYTEESCAECGRRMVVKWGRKGRFLSCSGFPECKFAKSITSGVKCPQQGCPGELVERRGWRGRFFYGCSEYPRCKWTGNKLPV
ncbi:MAG: type I DNA topoisomerase [Candidatus Omnitrophota bacterium]